MRDSEFEPGGLTVSAAHRPSHDAGLDREDPLYWAFTAIMALHSTSKPRVRRPMSYLARTSPWLKPRRKMACRSIDHEQAMEFSFSADRAAIEGRRQIAAMVRQEQEA